MSETEPDPETALAASARAGARWRVGLGAGVVLLVLGVAIAVIAGLVTGGGGAQPLTELTPSPDIGVTPASSLPTALASVVVHVLGHVQRPGVYELPDGSRVIDAVGAAGGFSDDADPGGLNLARVLVDGEQVVVPKPGDDPPPSATTPPGAEAGAAPGAKVDLNTATLEQLETLPRVGPAMAQRIVDWRTQNGKFASIDDLKNVTGIGDKTFADLEDLVVVR